MSPEIKVATDNDIPELRRLISTSAHALSQGFYTKAQVDCALTGVFGVDSQLITDGTYFTGRLGTSTIVGCGGWSYRATLFGSDDLAGRSDAKLVPGTDPAKIRAFFIHPDYARRGIASKLLEHCEAQAREAGFTSLELGSTLPGLSFYKRRGYIAKPPIDYRMNPQYTLRIVPMTKALD